MKGWGDEGMRLESGVGPIKKEELKIGLGPEIKVRKVIFISR